MFRLALIIATATAVTALPAAEPPSAPATDLARRLDAAEPAARAEAAEELALLGAAAAPAVPALVRLLDRVPEPSVEDWKAGLGRTPDDLPRLAADALVAIGPAAAPAAADLLSRPTDREWAHRRAAHVLARIGPPAEVALKVWTAALGDPDAEVRYLAAESLGRMGAAAESAVPALAAALAADLAANRDRPFLVIGHAGSGRAALIAALRLAGPKGQAVLRDDVLPKWLERLGRGELTGLNDADDLTAFGEMAAAAVPVIKKLARKEVDDCRPGGGAYLKDLLRLGPAGRVAVEELLTDADPAVRAAAATQGATWARAEVSKLLLPHLLATARDTSLPEPNRLAAAEALCKAEGPAAAAAAAALADVVVDGTLRQRGDRALDAGLERFGGRAVPALSRWLKSPDARSRATAAVFLGRIGPAARPALPALRAMAAEEEPWPRVSGKLATALIGRDPADARALGAELTHPDVETRKTAVLAVPNLGPAAGALVPALAAVAKGDPDPDVRREALDALAGLGCRLPAAAEAAVAAFPPNPFGTLPLPDVERDEAVTARRAAVRRVRGLGPALKPLLPALLVAACDDDNATATWALESIGGMGPAGKEAVPTLVRLAARGGPGPRKENVSYVLDALGQIGPAAAPAVPAARKYLTVDREYDRWSAAECLAGIGPAAKDAIPDLRAAAGCPLPGVRVRAAYALFRITGERGPNVRAIERPLLLAAVVPGTGTDALSPAAAAAAAYRASAADLPELVPAAVAALPRLEGWPQTCLIEGLAAAGPKAAAAVPVLTRLLSSPPPSGPFAFLSPSPDVEAVCRALGAIGPAAALARPKLRELADGGDPWLAAAATAAVRRIDAKK